VEVKPTTPTIERPHIHALDCTARGIDE